MVADQNRLDRVWSEHARTTRGRKRALLSRYIMDPLLMPNGSKFHIRMHLLVVVTPAGKRAASTRLFIAKVRSLMPASPLSRAIFPTRRFMIRTSGAAMSNTFLPTIRVARKPLRLWRKGRPPFYPRPAQ